MPRSRKSHLLNFSRKWHYLKQGLPGRWQCPSSPLAGLRLSARESTREGSSSERSHSLFPPWRIEEHQMRWQSHIRQQQETGLSCAMHQKWQCSRQWEVFSLLIKPGRCATASQEDLNIRIFDFCNCWVKPWPPDCSRWIHRWKVGGKKTSAWIWRNHHEACKNKRVCGVSLLPLLSYWFLIFPRLDSVQQSYLMFQSKLCANKYFSSMVGTARAGGAPQESMR